MVVGRTIVMDKFKAYLEVKIKVKGVSESLYKVLKKHCIKYFSKYLIEQL